MKTGSLYPSAPPVSFGPGSFPVGVAAREPRPLWDLAHEYPQLPDPGRAFLHRLVNLQLLNRPSLCLFLEANTDKLSGLAEPQTIAEALVKSGLLTAYQADRVQAGTVHGLVLGSYRVLERLGSGNMGVVFLAEHYLMKRRVAVKVLPVDDDSPAALMERFYGEIRVLSNLHHPNIVTAFDAGEVAAQGPRQPALLYLVMELVAGGDLEQYVVENGVAPLGLACDWIRQAACGLQEAHDHHLIHRDVKPSNLLLTQDGRVKVVDFGLVRQFCSRLTIHNCLLGTVDFMAPEQSRDASLVGAEADIYGLGASLFWLLTGEPPFPEAPSVAAALRALQGQRPRRLRQLRPEAPPDLDALIDQMLDPDPSRRPPMSVTVMNALNRFALPSSPSSLAEFLLEAPEPVAEQLHSTNERLEKTLRARAGDVRETQDALLYVLGKMAQLRDGETPAHHRRLQRYVHRLAKEASNDPAWQPVLDKEFLDRLERCVPLHDIGKVALPDSVLLKPGPLTPAERAGMEAHTVLGVEFLEDLARQHGRSLPFLGMAVSIVRHHHERWDGRGYPDGLAGDDIPPAARLVAVADFYDAMRRPRFHKAAMPHDEVARLLLEGGGTQFDPALVTAFAACQADFDRIFSELPD